MNAIWNTANGEKRSVTIEKFYFIDGKEWAKIWYDGLCFRIVATSIEK